VCSIFLDKKKSESFAEVKGQYCSSAFQIKMERSFGLKIRESDYYFGLKRFEVSESQISVSARNSENENANANERILNQMDDIRQVLEFEGESRIECCLNFQRLNRRMFI
jgi:hypothetical protein